MIREMERTGKLGGPTLESTDVATAVTQQLFSGYGAQLVVPSSMGWTSMIRGFPVWLQERLRDTVSTELLAAMEAAGMRAKRS